MTEPPSSNRRSLLAGVRTRIGLALGLLALTSLAGFAVFRGVLRAHDGHGIVINVAGKQRMLSQRASRLLLEIALAPDTATASARRSDLESVLETMRRDHDGLVHGDPERGLPGTHTAPVAEMYHGEPALDARVRGYIETLGGLAHLPRSRILGNPTVVSLLDESRTALLRDLDTVVYLYEDESQAAIRRLEIVEGSLVGVTLLVLLLEALLIYRPMLAALRTQIATIDGQRDRLQLILDNTGDALLLVDRDGRPGEIRSRAAEDWFGPTDGESPVWDRVFADDTERRELMELGWETLREDVMPAEVALAQLPHRVEQRGRTLALTYTPVVDRRADRDPDTATPDTILVAARDISEQLARQSADARARQLHAFVACLLRDKAGADGFVKEIQRLMSDLPDAPVEVQTRLLHSIKGLTAIHGLLDLSERAHALEDLLAEEGRLEPATIESRLRRPWESFLAEIERFLVAEEPNVKLSLAEYAAFVEAMEVAGEDVLLRTVRSWRSPRFEIALRRLERQAMRLAKQLGVKIDVHVDDHGLRGKLHLFDPFVTELIHVLRNAVDHGFEAPDDREREGKPRRGTLWLEARPLGRGVEFVIGDDGRGIDWEAIRRGAQGAGLPHATETELFDALFHEGLSASDAVTELSGRGVGLAAVRQEVKALGGRIALSTAPGRGTTWRFSFDRAEFAASQSAGA